MRFREDVDIAGHPAREADVGSGESLDYASESPGRLDVDTDRVDERAPHDASPMGYGEARVASASPIDLGVRQYLGLILRYKLLIMAVLGGTMVITVTRLLLKPDTYTARATILPSGGQAKSGVLGLIASFTGAPPLAGMSEEISSFLFPTILQSRQVGLEVLRATYTFKKDGKTVERTLEEQLQAESLDKALKTLYMIASFDVHKETAMITVAATTRYPDLSAQIVNRFVDSLERVNLEMRRASARQNSTFIRERLEESLRELRLAEQNLTVFRQQNVRINAPELELEKERLKREVSLKSQLFMTLANQAEVARIDEAKDLPVVRILDRASVPKLPVPVPKFSSLALGGIAGVLFAIMAVAGIEILHYLRREVAASQRLIAGLAHR